MSEKKHCQMPALEDYLRTRSSTPLGELLALPAAQAEARGLVGLPREILQQPWLYRETARRVLASAELAGFLAPTIGRGKRWVLCGAGSSNFLGEAIAPWMTRGLAQPVHAIASTDVLVTPERLRDASEEPALFLHFSRSGGTTEAIASLELLRRLYPHARHLAITCNGASALARAGAADERSRALVLHPASHDHGLAMTSSVTSMMVAGLTLAQRGPEAESDECFLAQIDRIAEAAERLIERAPSLAQALVAEDPLRLCALGADALRATAKEACLKVTELTDGAIASFSDSWLGVRHGPLSAVNERTLVIGSLSTSAYRRAYEIDFLRELESKRLGARLAVVAPFRPTELPESVRCVSFGPATTSGAEAAAGGEAIEDELRPLVDILFSQVLGLYASLHHGLTPDRPSRRGAIQRVVAGFQLHAWSAEAELAPRPPQSGNAGRGIEAQRTPGRA
ncbi:MAG: SIS domain-containing protein [Planctomycetes bacterium]|nr:SIS domain-containing protein [Planctomycetota bacterium]